MSAILVEQSYCLNCIIPGNGLASEVGILAPDKTGRLIMNLLVLKNESCGWQRVRKLGREVVSEQRYTEARIKREQARARVSARRDRCRGADEYLPSAPTY
jgi:hypothetical protein